MLRRWTAGIVCFVLLISLAIPLQAYAAGADGSSPGASEQQPTGGNPDQELPLPGGSEGKVSALAAGDSLHGGLVRLGTIDGYTISNNGEAVVYYDKPSGGSQTWPIDIVNGSIDLGRVDLPPGAKVTLSLTAYYTQSSTGKSLIYIDEDEMTAEQLAALTKWTIDADAVEAPLNLSSYADWADSIMTVLYDNTSLNVDTPAMEDLAVLTKPGRLDLAIAGSKDHVGYLISKSFEVASGNEMAFTADDVAAASRIQLPVELDNYSIWGDGAWMSFSDVHELIVTAGKYSLSGNQNKLTENGERVTAWSINILDAQGDKELKLGVPRLSTSQLSITAKKLLTVVNVNSGDFQLGNIMERNGSTWQNLVKTSINIVDSEGNSVYETELQPNGWCCETHTFDPPLADGKYSIEYEVVGLDSPLTLQKSFTLPTAVPVYEGKGLVIQAENEAGQPLAKGQVFLFEKQPPWIGGPNDGSNTYTTSLTYQSKASSNGDFVIPYAKLLKGHSYELEVLGTSTDGKHPVVYHRAVSSDDQQIAFKGAGLKHVTVQAAQASPGDSLLFSIVDDQQQFANWPVLSQFNEGHEAELYIQTDNALGLVAKLYDESTDTGYYLTGTATAGGTVQTVIMNGATVEIGMPSGFANAKLEVNPAWGLDAHPAKHYMVSKGSNVTAAYYVEAGDYRYSFVKELGNVDGNTTLQLGSHFENKQTEKQLFYAGQLNKRVYTDYRDEYDNALVDVSPVEVALIADRVASDGIDFTVAGDGLTKIMTVRSDKGVLSYDAADRQVVTSQSWPGGSAIDYQLYNASNQKVSDLLHTTTPVLVNANIPLSEGSYTLQLAAQNFPSDVVKLAGQANLAVEDVNEPSIRIPVALPPGFTEGSYQYGNAAIQPLNGESFQGYAWLDHGTLRISDTAKLISGQKYALHLELHLKSPSGESVLYYNQLILTGAQLLTLRQVEYPTTAVMISPDVNDLPRDLDLRDGRIEFPVAGFEEMRYSGFFDGRYVRAGKWQVGKIIMKPQDFQLVFNGVNGLSTAYDLRRSVHMNSTGIETISDLGTHLVHLQGGVPFSTIRSVTSGVLPNNFSYYLIGELNKAYVGTGKQQFRFATRVSRPDEDPWDLFWITRSTYDVNKDIVIPFTGHVDPASSSLKLKQRTENGKIVLTLSPELVSGDLLLTDLDVGRSGNYSNVPAIVAIKDSQQKKIYEGLAYYWEAGSIEVAKALAEGTYTVTFSQPVGPNEEVVLTNSFTVASTGGGPTGGGGGGGFPGGGGGVVVPGGDQTDTESPSKTVTFKPEDIPAPVKGVVTLAIQDSQEAVIPGSMLSGNGTDNDLELQGSHGKVTIPSSVLKQLAAAVGKDKLADAQFSLSLTPIGGEELAKAVKPASGTAIKPAGTVYEFKLSITAKDGQPILISTFDQPITLTFDLNADADRNVTNVYYIAADGSLTYVPGRLVNGQLVAQVSHFSKYGVLELRTAFSDVGAKHWAYPAIEALAAKQIITGTAPGLFAPSRTVTRAEFTAMLVHAMGLSTDRPSAFKDVPATAWYASAVSAAYRNHLVTGISADAFAPNKPISREEMAVVLANALKSSGIVLPAAQTATFKDAAQISKWAAEAVGVALTNGLIEGNKNGLFAPKGMATRAEAAQMLANFLNRVNQ